MRIGNGWEKPAGATLGGGGLTRIIENRNLLERGGVGFSHVVGSTLPPSATAQRPGDVLTQYGGTTVEVLNTDAEGRLILADAIVRACEDNPDYLIETSTLTGAQTVALGARIPGVMGSDEFRDRLAALQGAKR